MKRVGILTYHFAINYGAILQCYALKRVISKLGYESKVLNYITNKQEENNKINLKTLNIKNIIREIILLRFYRVRKNKINKFNYFIKENLNLSEKTSNLEELNILLKKDKYDAIVCGSDQVWNINIKDFEEAFFLPIDFEVKKIGYAISIGNSTEEELKKYNREIRDFKNISVREKKAIPILNKISSMEIIEVLDPTLLLKKNEWNLLLKGKENAIKKPYIVCYLLKKEVFDLEYKLIEKIKEKYKLEIYFINQRYSKYSFKKNTLYDIGIEEFLLILKEAELIITDSFHGTLFSIIYEKEFITLIEKKNLADTRRQNILEKLELEVRGIYLDQNYNLDFSKIDYKKVNNKLNKYREESLKYLKESLI